GGARDGASLALASDTDPLRRSGADRDLPRPDAVPGSDHALVACAHFEIVAGRHMIEKGFAERFAKEWVAAWNSHDLERVLEHYEDDFEMSSPIITTLIGEPSGKLRGKAAVGAYWAKALRAIPDLRFELLAALAGVNSITVYYRGHRGLAAEVLHFSASGKVREAFAHYAEDA